MIETEYDDKSNSSMVPQMMPLLLSSTTLTHPADGFDCLKTLDSLYIKQYSSLSEVIFGVASESKFDIFNEKNERIFQALESSTFLQRFSCSARRRFTLRILDNQNQDILVIKRQFKCCSGCCWCANAQCCSQEVTVESPSGTLIGTVSQEGSCCRSRFAIKDANGNHVLTLVGPLAGCDEPLSCRCENKFTLIGTHGMTEIGGIYKKYRGFLQEAVTSADAFLLKVPMDLDVKMKIMSLAALFLIEYMIYAAVPQNN